MSCVRCGRLKSYKLSTKARDILGYSSDIELCKDCIKNASNYISNKGKSLILKNNKVILHKKIKEDLYT